MTPKNTLPATLVAFDSPELLKSIAKDLSNNKETNLAKIIEATEEAEKAKKNEDTEQYD